LHFEEQVAKAICSTPINKHVDPCMSEQVAKAVCSAPINKHVDPCMSDKLIWLPDKFSSRSANRVLDATQQMQNSRTLYKKL